MRFIKLALISFLFFFLLLTGISLFIPSRIRISKATNLYATPERTLAFINDTATWKHWHPVYQQALKQDKLHHLNVQAGTRTDSVITFHTQNIKGQRIINGFQVYRFPSTESLTLQWYMDFNLRWYPWEKFGSLFYESTYGQYMQQGLEQLKKSIEQ